MGKITEFFKDDAGALSSMRLIFIVWAVGVAAVWGVVAIKTMTIPDVPTGILSVFGILTAGKVTQSMSENKK
jgi:hypothetical protein